MLQDISRSIEACAAHYGLVSDTGSERLPNAVPMFCDPGDVIISNRQIVHGSIANTGFEPRNTVNFGFYRRSSKMMR